VKVSNAGANRSVVGEMKIGVNGAPPLRLIVLPEVNPVPVMVTVATDGAHRTRDAGATDVSTDAGNCTLSVSGCVAWMPAADQQRAHVSSSCHVDVPRVSRAYSPPTTAVISVMPIGYQSPA
jgi:hypothetical protein